VYDTMHTDPKRLQNLSERDRQAMLNES
jgi:hypothetical protein